MKKIISLFFTFVVSFSTSSFAGFMEAAILFEQEQYNEAYDEFFECYQHHDLRGNAYLRHLILTKKIDDVRKEFWSEHEFQKLEDTTSIRSEKSLKTSILYQEFLKTKNKTKTEKNVNKKKKLYAELKKIVAMIDALHKESIARATLILVDLTEDIQLRNNLNLSESSVYYDYALKWHVDRDVYINALQKGRLETAGYETYKTYAKLLEKFNSNGQGEFIIYKSLESKKNLMNDEAHFRALGRWVIQAAHLGNQEALKIVLVNQLVQIKKKNKINDASYIRDSSILTCFYKAAYDGLDKGYYACLLGNFFDENHQSENFIIWGVHKNNNKAIFWYEQSKNFGHYLGEFNYLVLCDDFYKKKQHLIQDYINYFNAFANNVLKIKNDPSEYNNDEHKKILSKKIIQRIEIMFSCENLDYNLLLQSLNYVVECGEIEDKNKAKYLKYLLYFNDHLLEDCSDTDALQLLLDSSETCNVAMSELGYVYEYGKLGQEIDFDKMYSYYNRVVERMVNAGEKDVYLPLYNLSTCYLNGRGCEKDYIKAYELLKKAYALAPHDADVVNDLMCCCFNLDSAYNKDTYKFTQLAVQMDIPFADINLAICHLFGRGCKQDIDAAKIVFNKYYEEQNAVAAYLLGKIELIEFSSNKALKYFKNVLLWANFESALEEYLTTEAASFLISTLVRKDSDGSDSSGDDENLDLDTDIVDDEFDYQRIVEEERQKSLNKKSLKNVQYSNNIAEKIEENKHVVSLSKLKRKQRETFASIMDSSKNKEVKWIEFEKLVGALMRQGDFLKPVGGSKINIKLGGKQKQFHMPEHNESAPLDPGRIKKARQLLSNVLLDDQSS